MTAFTGRDTVVIVRRVMGAPDNLGVPTRIETREVVWNCCSVQPLGTDELLSDVDRVITRWKLYAPADVNLTSTDAVESNGLLYEVDGDPQIWADVRGVPHHLTCLLRRATG